MNNNQPSLRMSAYYCRYFFKIFFAILSSNISYLTFNLNLTKEVAKIQISKSYNNSTEPFMSCSLKNYSKKREEFKSRALNEIAKRHQIPYHSVFTKIFCSNKNMTLHTHIFAEFFFILCLIQAKAINSFVLKLDADWLLE